MEEENQKEDSSPETDSLPGEKEKRSSLFSKKGKQFQEISKTIGEKAASLLGPEAVIMLFVAILVDGGEFLVELIPVIGQIISIAIDIFALIFFGLWMWFRSGIITVPKKTGARIVKATKLAKRIKWLKPACFIIEMIPIISSLLPLWILVVYLELKYNSQN